jgi:hypothetical protein
MDNPLMTHLISSSLHNKKEILFGNMEEIYHFHNRWGVALVTHTPSGLSLLRGAGTQGPWLCLTEDDSSRQWWACSGFPGTFSDTHLLLVQLAGAQHDWVRGEWSAPGIFLLSPKGVPLALGS